MFLIADLREILLAFWAKVENKKKCRVGTGEEGRTSVVLPFCIQAQEMGGGLQLLGQRERDGVSPQSCKGWSL